MLKGLLIGVVLGGIVAAIALKALDRAQAGTTGSGDAKNPGAGEDPEETGGLKRSLDEEKAALETLRKKLEDGRKELASLEAPVGGGGEVAQAKKATWKDMAPALAKAMKQFRQRPGEENPEEGEDPPDRADMEKVMLQMFALLTQIATERGMGMNEAMLCPEGFPALIQELLAVGDPPASPEQLAAVQALAGEHKEAFEAFLASKGNGTVLEDRLAMTTLSDKYREGMQRALSPEQHEKLGAIDMFGMGMGGTSWTSGSRETVTENLSKSWTKALKLTDAQAHQLGPIVTEYIAACEGAYPGRGGTDERKRLEAQIAAQKKIAGSIGLTEEQADALKKWSTTYGFWIAEPVAPAPVGEESR